MTEMYALESKPYLPHAFNGDGYYTGNSYIYQGEKYAVCDHFLHKAKLYKSQKVAQRIAENNNFANYSFRVVKVFVKENGIRTVLEDD